MGKLFRLLGFQSCGEPQAFPRGQWTDVTLMEAIPEFSEVGLRSGGHSVNVAGIKAPLNQATAAWLPLVE